MKNILTLIFLQLLLTPVFSQISFVSLTGSTISGCSNSTTITTSVSGGYQADNGDVILVFTQNRSTTANEPTSISGGGVTTWTKLETATYTSGTRRISAYIGVSAGGDGTQITATWPVSQNQRYMSVYTVDGTPKGSDGLDAIFDSGTNTGSSTTVTATLSTIANPSSSSMIWASGVAAVSATGTAETDWTELRDEYSTSCFAQHRWIYNMQRIGTTDNTPTVTTTSSMDYAIIAIAFNPNKRRISTH